VGLKGLDNMQHAIKTVLSRFVTSCGTMPTEERRLIPYNDFG
jgi:hypothetical protein